MKPHPDRKAQKGSRSKLTKLNFTVASVALIFAPAMAAPIFAQPQDVSGWGKIKWGVTIDEAKALYPDLRPIQETRGTGQALIFNDFELDPSQAANITFYAEKTMGITDILLMFTKVGGKVGGMDIESLPGSLPAKTRREIFDDMKKLLLEKYGAPKSDENRIEGGFERTTMIWIFPSTLIEFQLSQSVRYAQLGRLSISYRSARKNPL
jgi:hypothetical protein